MAAVEEAYYEMTSKGNSNVNKSTVSPDPFTDDYSAEEKVKKLDRDPLRDALEKVEKVTKEDTKKTGKYEGKSADPLGAVLKSVSGNRVGG